MQDYTAPVQFDIPTKIVSIPTTLYGTPRDSEAIKILKFNFDPHYQPLTMKDMMQVMNTGKRHRILCLSDSRNLIDHSTLACKYKPVAQPFDATILATDYIDGVVNKEQKPPKDYNGFMYQDNTQLFNLPDGLFDLIVMRAGICHCKTVKEGACALPSSSIKVAAQFLSEVGRMLKDGNRSRAYLHGDAAGGGKAAEIYWKSAREIALSVNKNLVIELVHYGGVLRGIVISKNDKW